MEGVLHCSLSKAQKDQKATTTTTTNTSCGGGYFIVRGRQCVATLLSNP
jgi:hypothetical protein